MYNRIAGQSLERIAALSDGLFAIAMTLIVLEIHVPAHDGIATDGALWQALVGLAPRFTTYLLSFLTLGIFWTGQQTQLNFFSHADRDLAWIHFGFLAVVSLLPFSTTLLAEFITLRLALLLYWANIFALGLLLYLSWAYASRAKLVKDAAPEGISAAVRRRIVVAQALYAIGALLCLVDTTWSIGFIVLVQLNYAVAPRIGWLYRFS
ncbi:MAG TPA: TMEM175 family protein [Candidatus Sulfotelmatobacter sp.]|nr:TMEM175 family protein [Candidatus Sulfotelmatobacter sp.]